MPAGKEREKLRDIKQKVGNAKEAAERDDASDRDQADLKLLEQEALAAELSLKHAESPGAPSGPGRQDTEAKLDKALKDSFPGSDPVAFTQAAPINKDDASLASVSDSKREDL